MKLSEWSNVSEIASSIIVVVSLFFLIFEIRENTETLQRTSYDQITQSMIDIRRDAIVNPDVADRMSRFFNGDELSQVERSQVARYGANLYSNYERAFWANEYGHMGESEWLRFANSACGTAPLWAVSNQNIFTLEFREFIANCDL